VRFSRSHIGGGGTPGSKRDRNAIVGLSGWLFADLLLGIAVIFLVGSDPPGKPAQASGKPVKADITIVENVQTNGDEWTVSNQGFKINVHFSEDVYGFNPDDDLSIQGDAIEWIPQVSELADLEIKAADYIVEMTPKAGLLDGKFQLSIPANTVRSESGVGNLESKEQAITFATCLSYKGVDARTKKEDYRVESKGFRSDVPAAYFEEILKKSEIIVEARKREAKVGFVLFFVSVSQESIRDGTKKDLEQALINLELLDKPNGLDNCDTLITSSSMGYRGFIDRKLVEGEIFLDFYFVTKNN